MKKKNIEREDLADEPYMTGNSGVNDKYNAPGTIGSYCTDPEPFKNPAGVKLFAGFGASEEDIERGYNNIGTRELPNYDKANYNLRYSEPAFQDENFGNSGILPEDIEFRNKDRVSKGFLTRPRIPTER
jgi:hypothetical protein